MTSVWALPCSLAATLGISFDFFSSAYLDVSVRQVLLLHTMYSYADDEDLPSPGFPIRIPSGRRSIQLTEAFRRFTRPSSPVDT